MTCVSVKDIISLTLTHVKEIENHYGTFLTLLSGIGWIIVYEECIRLGIRQKTYAMPFWALALNITWEAIYAYSDIFLEAHGKLGGMQTAQVVVNVLWVCCDFVILYTYFRYGKKE